MNRFSDYTKKKPPPLRVVPANRVGTDSAKPLWVGLVSAAGAYYLASLFTDDTYRSLVFAAGTFVYVFQYHYIILPKTGPYPRTPISSTGGAL